MSVLTSQQTTHAVRGLIYFGAHDFNGPLDLFDCSGEIASDLETLTTSTDKNMPVEEEVRVRFLNVKHDDGPIPGLISVIARITWPSLQERMRQGSPHFKITTQPNLSQTDVTRNFLVAFSRLIAKHNDEVRRFRERYKDEANAPIGVEE
ncbi:MAG: hypothetical protein AAF684_01630 [Pseudomonadota bacterium]